MEENDPPKPILMVFPPNTVPHDGITTMRMISYDDLSEAMMSFDLVPRVETNTRGTQVDCTAAKELGYNRDQHCQTKRKKLREISCTARPEQFDFGMCAKPEYADSGTSTASKEVCDASCNTGSRVVLPVRPMGSTERKVGDKPPRSGNKPKDPRLHPHREHSPRRRSLSADLKSDGERPAPMKKKQIEILRHHLGNLKNLFKSISHNNPSRVFCFTERYLDHVIGLSKSLTAESIYRVIDRDRMEMKKFKENPLWKGVLSNQRHTEEDTGEGNGDRRLRKSKSADEASARAHWTEDERRPTGIAAPNVRLSEEDRRSSAKRRRLEHLGRSSRSPLRDANARPSVRSVVRTPSPSLGRSDSSGTRTARPSRLHNSDPRLAARSRHKSGRPGYEGFRHDNDKRSPSNPGEKRRPSSDRHERSRSSSIHVCRPDCAEGSKATDICQSAGGDGGKPGRRVKVNNSRPRIRIVLEGKLDGSGPKPTPTPEKSPEPTISQEPDSAPSCSTSKPGERPSTSQEDFPSAMEVWSNSSEYSYEEEIIALSPGEIPKTPPGSPNRLEECATPPIPEASRSVTPPEHKRGPAPANPSTPVRDEPTHGPMRPCHESGKPYHKPYRRHPNQPVPPYQQNRHLQKGHYQQRGPTQNPHSDPRSEGSRISTIPITIRSSRDEFPSSMLSKEPTLLPSPHSQYYPPQMTFTGGSRSYGVDDLRQPLPMPNTRYAKPYQQRYY